MKKTIFLFTIIILAALLVPVLKAEAVFMRVGVTVTSLTIPERAAMLQIPVDTEFQIDSQCYIEILSPQGLVVKRDSFGQPFGKGDAIGFVFEHTGGNFIPRISIVGVKGFLTSQYANCQPSAASKNLYRIRVCQRSRGSSCGSYDYCPTPPSYSSTDDSTSRNTLYFGVSAYTYWNFAPITL